MDDVTIKAMYFGTLIVAVYGLHQATVGGDGVVFASVVAAVCSIGGFAYGRGRTDRV